MQLSPFTKLLKSPKYAPVNELQLLVLEDSVSQRFFDILLNKLLASVSGSLAVAYATAVGYRLLTIAAFNDKCDTHKLGNFLSMDGLFDLR